MDKISRTLLMLPLLSSTVIIFICIVIYITKQQLQQPLLVLNLIILLIIASSRCFSCYINPTDHDDHMILLPCDPPQRIIPLNPITQAERIAEGRTSEPKVKEKLESTWKTTKEGTGHLRQLKHLNLTEDNVKSSEMLRDREVMSLASSSSSSTAKLRKEMSLTKEEVNRRVEAFIRKFNDD